jgi:hypothetical protein
MIEIEKQPCPEKGKQYKRDGLHSPNENKMSYRERERVSLRIDSLN